MTVTDKDEIVNTLNEQFKSVFASESVTVLPTLEKRTLKVCSDDRLRACLTES
jgi:hypothetical protein